MKGRELTIMFYTLDGDPATGEKIGKILEQKGLNLSANKIISFPTEDNPKFLLVHDEEWEGLSEGIKNKVKKYAKDKNEIYIALHESGPKQSQEKGLREILGNKKLHFSTYTRESHNEQYKQALAFIKESNPRQNEHLEKLKEAIKKGEKGIIKKTISLLKHRIAHLWLALDIDLQGIQEVSSHRKGGVKFLQDVLRIKIQRDKNGRPIDNKGNVVEQAKAALDTHHYRRKLADLWWMLSHKIFNGEFAPSENKVQMLVEGNAIIDLIGGESRRKERVQEAWNQVVQTCGLSYRNDSLFNIEGYDRNSSIFKYMSLLDEKIKKKTIDKTDLKEVMEFPRKGFGEFKSFRDWFSSLDDSLDKLRDVI